MNTRIHIDEVNKILADCIPDLNDPGDTEVISVDGVRNNFTFRTQDLKAHTVAIKELIERLPDSFKQTGGGGNSMMNAGESVTGLTMRTLEPLIALGLAIGKIRFLASRDNWVHLPYGMPYFVVVAEEGEKVPDPIPLFLPNEETVNPQFHGGIQIVGNQVMSEPADLVPWIPKGSQKRFRIPDRGIILPKPPIDPRHPEGQN